MPVIEARSRRPDADATRMYFQRRGETPLQVLAKRALLAFGCLFLTTIVVYLDRAGYADNTHGGTGANMTFLDALYYATVSLSTTGYGDIVPATESARLINIFIVTPMRLLFLIVLVGSTLEVLTTRTRQAVREQRWRKKVDNHTIVIGFGVKGRSAVNTLVDDGVNPHEIVVIGQSREEVADATDFGCVGVIGDARRDDVLARAAIERCARIIIAADSDDTAVLITLNARRLAKPSAHIAVAAREAQNVPVFRQSGANAVITTAEAAGRLLGISTVYPVAGAMMEDLLDPGRGLGVVERRVLPEEEGKTVGDLLNQGELVLATVQKGKVKRFDQGKDHILRQNETLVVIRHGQTNGIDHSQGPGAHPEFDKHNDYED